MTYRGKSCRRTRRLLLFSYCLGGLRVKIAGKIDWESKRTYPLWLIAKLAELVVSF